MSLPESCKHPVRVKWLVAQATAKFFGMVFSLLEKHFTLEGLHVEDKDVGAAQENQEFTKLDGFFCEFVNEGKTTWLK